MTVYVDILVDFGWRLGPSCHLIGDTLKELHEFAKKIGMKRQWFQNERVPHYDLTASRRKKAIELWALPLTIRAFVGKIRTIEGYCSIERT